MALTTATRVKRMRPGIGDDPDVADRLTDCLEAASDWFETQAGPIAQANCQHRLSGNLTPVLRLPNTPIISVTTLTVSGVTWRVMASTDTDTGQEVFLPPHGRWLEARATVWPAGSGNIQISYSAGYATIPDDIQQAVALITLLLMEEANRLGIGGKTLGAEQINLVVRNAKDYQFIQETVNHYGRIY